jgi:hypothetical protein
MKANDMALKFLKEGSVTFVLDHLHKTINFQYGVREDWIPRLRINVKYFLYLEENNPCKNVSYKMFSNFEDIKL